MQALITGICGQDGSYLAELLLSKGYEVHGIVRHVANEINDHRLWRIKHILDKITLHTCDLTSYPTLEKVIKKVQPDELYHLGGVSYVKATFDDIQTCFSTNLMGTYYILEILKENLPKCKMYFAGTSEMYGNTTSVIQDEDTPFYPCSPYGISKYAAFNLCKMYRQSYKMFIVNGILFNHTSERRGEIFASRKITKTIAEISLGRAKELIMGNIDTYRDFGYAPEYVEAMWLMLQREVPYDFVIATNETHSIREIVEIAFNYVKLNYKDYLKISPELYRPNELYVLRGNYQRANKALGWQPKIKFKEIIERMVENDKRNYS